MTSLPYLLVVSLYLLLFYGCYVVLLRRNTFFELNRAYLLGSVVFSLLLPFLRLPGEAIESLPVGSITLPTFVAGSTTAIENDTWFIMHWFWLIYGIGIAIMIVRLGLNLWALFRLIRRGTKEQKSTYTLIRLSDKSAPSFSFGRYMVLNYSDARTESDVLLHHEEAHIHQYHTADILFLELVQIAFWFNPVLWFYKKALQEVHEFLADRAVLKTPQPDYPQQLVAYALNVSSAALITPFASKSTLKQRIIMLQKPASQRRALLSYVLVLPLVACLVMCTQSEQDQPQSELERTRLATIDRAVKVEGKVLSVVQHSPEFPGGIEKLFEYIGKNVHYPAAAQKANATGRVFVNFIVTKTGEITNVNVLKGIGYGADEEAVRVVRQMPRWIPARQNGQAVNVQYNLPIHFQLDSPEEKRSTKTSLSPPAITEKSAFFSVPATDADLQKTYKHFFINSKEVAFNEFKTYDKADIVEASASEQSIRIETN